MYQISYFSQFWNSNTTPSRLIRPLHPLIKKFQKFQAPVYSGPPSIQHLRVNLASQNFDECVAYFYDDFFETFYANQKSKQ